MRPLWSRLPAHRLLGLMRFWPPYWGAGIRVVRATPDFSELEVELTLRWWNRNYVGTQFGGSLYAMTDPFYMLMLMQQLGPGYVVWDQAATIRFRKPGLGPVRAKFTLPPARAAEIRAQADREPKVHPVFQVQVLDRAGVLLAEVEKTLYVRRKPPRS